MATIYKWLGRSDILAWAETGVVGGAGELAGARSGVVVVALIGTGAEHKQVGTGTETGSELDAGEESGLTTTTKI